MNDPGLDEPILDTADRINNTYQGDDTQQNENQPQSMSMTNTPNSGRKAEGKNSGIRKSVGPKAEESELEEERTQKRWWILSTAFPLVAATLGPLANLFSVCALVQTWRIKIPDGTRISDPKWVLALNSTSLALAIIANLFLLFNFARRVRYTIAQPITITLWYTSAVLLLVPLCTLPKLSSSTSVHHTLSQSYFYAILSTILYTLISTLLFLHYSLFFSFSFSSSSLNLRPHHHHHHHHHYRHHHHDHNHNRHSPDQSNHFPPSNPSFDNITMPQRTLMLQTISFTLYLALGAGIFSSLENQSFVDSLYWADYTLLTIGLGSDFPPQTAAMRGILVPYAGVGLVIVGLVVGSVRGLVLDRAKEKVRRRWVGKERKRWIEEVGSDGKVKGTEKDKVLKSNEKNEEVGKREFEAMRNVLDRAETVRRYTALSVSFFAFLVLWFMGALVFWFTETNQNWTYPTSLYFTYITLLTIGYGDFVPQSNAGKPFFVLWTLIAVPTVTILISNMGGTVVRWVEKGTEWAGKKTVLPEKKGKQGKEGKTGKDETDSEPSASDAGGVEAQTQTRIIRNEIDKLGEAVERAEAAKQRGDEEEAGPNNRNRNRNEKKSLAARLAREVRMLARDVQVGGKGKNKKKKEYSWEEWKRWMELLREELHPRAREGDDKSGAHEVSDDSNDHDDSNDGGRTSRRDSEEEEAKWIWLSEDGPLFSGIGETEWIMTKLCERLEEVLEEEIGR
ncbi:voltage-gated potassium channel [Dendrothele bispora CBS 962.96]|uniref:Voltage-gated potassium channel n=1 Tax=Dendrothele bispora (strain CBS 962.96) TaxID=1314807 RepID=A0A4S8LR20_DENBC|nr:voltage-gated potassium channel [Dendrothele bispora CBS 962.96]